MRRGQSRGFAMPDYILALDQGTTSSRAILFDHWGRIAASAQREFRQILPRPGVVEHDPEEIWQSQLAVAQEALAAADCSVKQVAAIGIANQRETTVIWSRETGRPVGNAIVWQSRVSAPICEQLKDAGHEELFRRKTGLVLDAYFAGTKVKHLLDTNDGLREAAQRGEVLFGTIDTWLLWQLTGGRIHATDASNASRTLMFDIHRGQWDDELLGLLDVPRAVLPEVRPTSGVYGETDAALFGRPITVAALVGDQQAATFGQCCFEPGAAKNTYGTGAFLLMNTGETPVASDHRLLTTVGWTIGGQTTYCLEGSVFVAGAVVQWLRDGLGLIESSARIEQLAAEVDDAGGVYFVPALVGLGAPHWDPSARGAILGLSRGSTAAHLARAAVESMAYQSAELIDCMQADSGINLKELKVDGGASVNDMLLQFQADLLQTPVRRPSLAETTALGAAYLAGLAVGFWSDQAELARQWELDREFQSTIDATHRARLRDGWARAVERAKHWSK